MSSLDAGQRRYQREHGREPIDVEPPDDPATGMGQGRRPTTAQPSRRTRDLSAAGLGRLRHTARHGTLEERADARADLAAITDPDGTKARDQLQAELPDNLDRAHQRQRMRAGVPPPD